MPEWAVRLLIAGMVCVTVIIVIIKLADGGAFN